MNRFFTYAEKKDLTEEQREKLDDKEAEFEKKVEFIMAKKAEKRASNEDEDVAPREKAAKLKAFKEKRQAKREERRSKLEDMDLTDEQREKLEDKKAEFKEKKESIKAKLAE